MRFAASGMQFPVFPRIFCHRPFPGMLDWDAIRTFLVVSGKTNNMSLPPEFL
jgi:hypothetical protein